MLKFFQKPVPIRVENPPNGYEQIKRFYEPFRLAEAELPLKMLVYEGPLYTDKITLHVALIGSFETIMREIFEDYNDSYNKLRFYGSYNPRDKRGSVQKSMHAFGAAIDFNARDFPMETNGSCEKSEMPLWYQYVIHVFRMHGWIWGGDFPNADPMHFQYGHGY